MSIAYKSKKSIRTKSTKNCPSDSQQRKNLIQIHEDVYKQKYK